MKPYCQALLASVLLASVFSASGYRASVKVDGADALLGRAKKVSDSCHTAIMKKFQTASEWDPVSLPKGLHELESYTLNDAYLGSTEGIACSWQHIAQLGMDVCLTNWNELNKTLTPANDVSRAGANLYAKGYVCGMKDDAASCEAVDHCNWFDKYESCRLSGFYITLLFACHDSPVRDVSICIDYSKDSCKLDTRCKWHSFADASGGDALCLPTSVPDEWTLEDVYGWLEELFHDEASFYDNWGDCPTSHSWATLMSCSKHRAEDACGRDALCAWLDFLGVCTLNPSKIIDVMWGGDLKTVTAINKRNSYCTKLRTEGSCIRAMPNPHATRF